MDRLEGQVRLQYLASGDLSGPSESRRLQTKLRVELDSVGLRVLNINRSTLKRDDTRVVNRSALDK